MTKDIQDVSQLYKKKLVDRAVSLFCIFSLILDFVVFYKLGMKKYGVNNYLYAKYLFFSAMVFHVFCVVILYLLKKLSSSVNLSLSTMGRESLSKWEQGWILNAIPIFLDCTAVFVIAYFNCYLDTSKSTLQKTILFQEYIISEESNGNYIDTCFKIKHWQKEEVITSLRVCKKEFPKSFSGQEVELVVKAGYLGVPWLKEFHLLE